MFVSCPFFLLLGHVCCLPSVSSLLACAFLCFPLSRLFLFLCFSPVSSLWDRVRWYPRPWVGLCPGQGGWWDAPSFAFLSLLCFFSLGAGRVPAALVACAFLRLLSCLWLLSVLVISFFAVLCLVSCVWVVLPLLSFDFIYPYLSSSSPTPCKFLFFPPMWPGDTERECVPVLCQVSSQKPGFAWLLVQTLQNRRRCGRLAESNGKRCASVLLGPFRSAVHLRQGLGHYSIHAKGFGQSELAGQGADGAKTWCNPRAVWEERPPISPRDGGCDWRLEPIPLKHGEITFACMHERTKGISMS